MRRIWQRKNRLFFTVLFFVLLFVALMSWNRDDVYDNLEYVDGRFLNRDLLTLPVNQWVVIYPQHPKKSVFPNIFAGVNWHRQGHAGMTFVSNRGTLLIFGSDSHGENWDNSVHEFSPLTLEWIDHYPASPKETYRADKRGVAVAGENDLFPWAMHTYDSISYVPELGSLVVTSKIDHTPAPTELAKNARINPTWLYDLESKKWNILMQDNGPSFFASGSSYDPVTAGLWSYRQEQLWQLDAKARQWHDLYDGVRSLSSPVLSGCGRLEKTAHCLGFAFGYAASSPYGVKRSAGNSGMNSPVLRFALCRLLAAHRFNDFSGGYIMIFSCCKWWAKKLAGCADDGGASFASDALRSSVRPTRALV